MIPAQAIEAAMVAFAEAPYDPPPITEAQMKRANQAQMRAALEAAAPYMQALAWDAAVNEGESSGWLHDYAVDDLRKRNPYRPH